MDSLANESLWYAYQAIHALLGVLIWIVIIYVVLSWLISFNAINLRNRFVYRVAHLLDSVATPLLRPFRRILPSMGGLDFSPLVFILLVGFVNDVLLRHLFVWLDQLVGGGVPN